MENDIYYNKNSNRKSEFCISSTKLLKPPFTRLYF